MKKEHYTLTELDPIQAYRGGLLTAEEFKGFCKGNIIKYIYRYENKGGVDDLKIDSLDDLFADDDTTSDKKEETTNTNLGINLDGNSDQILSSPIDEDIPLINNINPIEPSTIPSIPIDKDDDAPMLPMDDMQKTNDSKDDEYDLQKELEAKFDELFGPIDDDNNT